MTAASLALDRIRGTRIAHLIETDGPGGAERMVAALARAFAESGCPGIAVVPRHGEGWLRRELANAVEAVPFALDGRPSLRTAAALAALLRARRVQLVHSHEFTMAVYGAAAARWLGVPHVITMHGGAYYASAPHRRFALGAAARMSDGMVAVSESVARRLRADLRLGNAPVTVIRNGVRPTPPGHPTLRAELGLSRTDRLIVTVGNLYPVKGHDTLIDALALLDARAPRTHVAIAGRGDQHDQLRAQAERLGIGSRVHLLGYRGDVADLLASADVFALPSRSEGLPLALLEAMFAGLPIVATDVGEVSAVLGAHAGLVVPPGDDALFAAALTVVLGDSRSAAMLGAAARARAAAEFDLARVVERYAALYARQMGAVAA